MRRTISGVFFFFLGGSLGVWGWNAPRSYSTIWALFLALVVSTGAILAIIGLWRMIPLKFLVRTPEQIRWEEVYTAADDSNVWPPAPKWPHHS